MIIRPNPDDVRAYRDANQCSIQEARRHCIMVELEKVISKIEDKNVADVLETLVHYAHLR